MIRESNRRKISAGVALLGLAFILSGCAAFSPDGGMETVKDIASTRIEGSVVALRSEADAIAARETVTRLLKRPLTARTAVQIALLNNRELQAAYNALGIQEAIRVQASLPPNPVFSLSRVAGGGEIEIERQIVANILALATLPARADVAADRFRQAQLMAAGETVRIALETRRAYHRAVAARQLAGFFREAETAAQAAVELAKRLGETGAINKLDQARQQVFYAELATQLAANARQAEIERERLIRAMGLWGGDLAFRLPSALPALPSRPRHLATVEVEAVGRRIDLQMARLEASALAKSYGLTSATRFVNLLEVAGISKTTKLADGRRLNERGIAVEFEVPLFDFGEVRVRQAEATYMRAINLLMAKAVNARSEAREAYHSYRAAYDIARHYRREIVPLRSIISEEMLLRYNAMQIDVFALLAEARQRITSSIAAIEAERDFWIADTNLALAVVGGSASPSSDMTGGIAMSANAPAGGH